MARTWGKTDKNFNAVRPYGGPQSPRSNTGTSWTQRLARLVGQGDVTKGANVKK